MTPLFDIRAVELKAGKSIDGYLSERATGIYQCWESERPVYVDVHDLPLEWRTSNGSQPIEFVCERLHARGSRAIPVTGTEIDRGQEYLAAVRAVINRNREGVCLRLARDDIQDGNLLKDAVRDTLDQVGVGPNEADLLIDYRYVGRESIHSLRASTIEALQSIDEIGAFRNIAVAGSSVPDVLNKRDQGKVRREPRIELELWLEILANNVTKTPVSLSDYAVVGAHYVPPAKFVNPPARIRYTTEHDHVFRRAKRGEYRDLCKQLLEAEEYSGANFSAGDQRLHFSAMGRYGPGTPALWVGYDTNHHLELVSEQVWRLVQRHGHDTRFNLAKPTPKPWMQPELLDV